jgi:transcriptional antiterminator NusG
MTDDNITIKLKNEKTETQSTDDGLQTKDEGQPTTADGLLTTDNEATEEPKNEGAKKQILEEAKSASDEPVSASDETKDEDEIPSKDILEETTHVDERGVGGKKIPGHIIINSDAPETAKWYVVHTTSGHEARIAETLRQRLETMGLIDKVFEILIPTQDRVIIRSGKKATVKEKIFPGYMLVKMTMDDPTWLAVRTTPGITGFVGAGKTPTPLSEGEVANIQKFVSSPAKRFKTRFSKGEAVKITDGPFSDFLGTIHEIDEEKGKVKVLVSIFGRETPVELDLLQIAKV